jgi:hypothetical protein
VICLACGSEQSSGGERCSACTRDFAVFPPFVKANHVAQLQAALRHCRDNGSWAEFGDMYVRFTETSMNFQQRWLSQPGATLSQSLPAELRSQFGEGVRELDAALQHLEEAMLCIDQALESEEASLLEQADTLLTDFFKVGCAGCAILMEELEKSEPQDARGTMLDVRSS